MKKGLKEHKTSCAIIFIFILFYFRFASIIFSWFNLGYGQIDFFVYLTSLILIIVAALIYKPSINWKLKSSDIIIILVCYAFIIFFDNASNYLYRLWAPDPKIPYNQNAWNKIKEATPFYYYATTIVLGPIVEECFYRYGFQNFFKKYISEFKAIIITALIFGFLHIRHGLFYESNPYELIHLISYSGASISFSYSYYKTKSFAVPILLHILTNF